MKFNERNFVDQSEFVPGIPVKKTNHIFDPSQELIPHLTLNIPIKIDKKGRQYIGCTYFTPSKNYPEYIAILIPLAKKYNKILKSHYKKPKKSKRYSK